MRRFPSEDTNELKIANRNRHTRNVKHYNLRIFLRIFLALNRQKNKNIETWTKKNIIIENKECTGFSEGNYILIFLLAIPYISI